MNDEIITCSMIGQRSTLQQYCIDSQQQIQSDLEECLLREDKKELNSAFVSNMIDSWFSNFRFNVPSAIFLEFPSYNQDILTLVVTPAEFFLQTLELFGLPKGYINGKGQWPNYIKQL